MTCFHEKARILMLVFVLRITPWCHTNWNIFFWNQYSRVGIVQIWTEQEVLFWNAYSFVLLFLFDLIQVFMLNFLGFCFCIQPNSKNVLSCYWIINCYIISNISFHFHFKRCHFPNSTFLQANIRLVVNASYWEVCK